MSQKNNIITKGKITSLVTTVAIITDHHFLPKCVNILKANASSNPNRPQKLEQTTAVVLTTPISTTAVPESSSSCANMYMYCTIITLQEKDK